MVNRLCLASCSGIFLALGLVFISGGLCVYLLKPPDKVITNHVEKDSTIEKGHITYEQLQKPTLKISKKFYFFNLTNSEKFANTGGGVMPALKEIGPYTFTENRFKTLIETDDKARLNYTQTRTFVFDSSRSGKGLTDSDSICTINIPLVLSIKKLKGSTLNRRELNKMISQAKAKIFVCRPVKNLTWNYHDNFTTKAYSKGVLSQGYFRLQVNKSSDDHKVSVVDTGVSDITQVGQLLQWNGMEQLTIWNGDANMLDGTEGLFFKPGLEKGENLTVFDDDTQRSFELVYEKVVNHLGIPTYRYRISNITYKSAFTEKKNARYFSWCPDGMFNLKPTRETGAPVFGSKPHFLDGDPLLLNSVTGLKPDRKTHDSVIDVDPITGVTVNFQRRLQLNVQVNKTDKHVLESITVFENITGYNSSGVLYYPVVYINENAEIDSDFKRYIEGKGLTAVYVSIIAVPIGFAVVLIFGVLFIIISLGFLCGWRRKSNTKDYLNI